MSCVSKLLKVGPILEVTNRQDSVTGREKDKGREVVWDIWLVGSVMAKRFIYIFHFDVKGSLGPIIKQNRCMCKHPKKGKGKERKRMKAEEENHNRSNKWLRQYL